SDDAGARDCSSRARMSSFRVPIAAAAIAVATVFGCARLPTLLSPSEPAMRVARETITAAAIEAPIRFLSDDMLEGRAPGTRGYLLARQYIEAMMQWIGLQPGGPAGGWEQSFELVGVTTAAPREWVFLGSNGRHASFTSMQEFVVASGVERDSVAIQSAEVVFAGYAIQAPEYDWDDFKGEDVRGKLL